MSADCFLVPTGIVFGLGVAWTFFALVLWDYIPITTHNTWHLWPLWAGPLIMVGSPLIVLVLYLLFLPCLLFLLGEPAGRPQQPVARTPLQIQMEAGIRENQIHIEAANAAEAARLAAEPPAAAPEPAAPAPAAPEPATPHEGGGTGGDTGGSPPANDAKGNDTSTATDYNSKDKPQSGGVAEPEAVEKLAATPGNTIASTVAPPAPAHTNH